VQAISSSGEVFWLAVQQGELAAIDGCVYDRGAVAVAELDDAVQIVPDVELLLELRTCDTHIVDGEREQSGVEVNEGSV
jgi:hypothetical protein